MTPENCCAGSSKPKCRLSGLRRSPLGASIRDERLLSDLIALQGAGTLIQELPDTKAAKGLSQGVIRIGVHRKGPLPKRGIDGFDVLLTMTSAAPAPWVSIPEGKIDDAVADLANRVQQQPIASAIAAQLLRLTLSVDFDQALVLESLGYSLLLGAGGFKGWREANPSRQRASGDNPRVAVAFGDALIEIKLNRLASRNAFDARMRDELVEALQNAADDPDGRPVELSGLGPDFSAGGDLDEFGTSKDPGPAHLIRILRSPARLVHDLGERLIVRVQGAAIGAGIEISAAARTVVGVEGAHFRLPEIAMGLIPGAGGLATIPRRIGRHRTLFMALSGCDLDLPTAVEWGLVDRVVPQR